MLVVDQSGSTRFGEPVTKAGLAVEVAAVLALAAAYQNDRVGALLFADEVERVIPPRKGRRHALRVIRDLVAFEPAGRRTNLGRQPVLCQPAAASPEHRGRALRFHRRRMGAAAAPAGRPARGRGDHRGRSPRARSARIGLDRDDGCGVGPAGAGGHREPRGPAPGWPSWPSSGGRNGPAPRPRPARTRCVWTPAATMRFRSVAPSPSEPAGSTADDRPRRCAALLLPGPPTVGDTIWVTRTVAVPSGRTSCRPTGDPADPVELLGPASGRRPAATPREISYPVVIWRPGPPTLEIPGPLLLGAGGGVDSLPRQRVTLQVASVLPRPCLIRCSGPQPRADFVPAANRSAADRRCWLAGAGRPALARRSTGGGAGGAGRARRAARRSWWTRAAAAGALGR